MSAPAEAVQIASRALFEALDPDQADASVRIVVAALARAGWLCDPAEVAALRRDLAFALAANERLTATRDELFGTRKRLEAEVAALRKVAAAARLQLRGPSPDRWGAAVAALAALEALTGGAS